jgi:hypothetical protein
MELTGTIASVISVGGSYAPPDRFEYPGTRRALKLIGTAVRNPKAPPGETFPTSWELT